MLPTFQLTEWTGAMPAYRPAVDPAWPADHTITYQLDIPRLVENGDVLVSFGVRGPLRNGDRSTVRSTAISGAEVDTFSDPDDRRILSLLFGTAQSMFYRQHDAAHSEVFLPRSVERALVELMAKTGRCVLTRDEASPGDAEPVAVSWDPGAPWDVVLRIDRVHAPKKGAYALGAFLTRAGDGVLAARDVLAITQGGLIFRAGSVGSLRRASDGVWIQAMLTRGPLSFNEGDLDRVLRMIHATPDPPALHLPKGVRVERITAAPQPLVRISRTLDPHACSSGARRTILVADLLFRYGSIAVPVYDPRTCVYETEHRRCFDRDQATEGAARRIVAEAGFSPLHAQDGQSEDARAFTIAPADLARGVETLMQRGWDVEVDGQVYRRPRAMKMQFVGSGIDWFSLDGSADFGGQFVKLPALMHAMANGNRFIRLGDGSNGMLPEEWINRLGMLRSVAQTDAAGRVSMRASQIGLIDMMIDQDPEIEFDAQVRRARQRLRSFTRIRARNAPPGFVGELRPYQREGLGWLHFLRNMGFGGCLADDMGLGKTVQVLALLEQRRRQRERDKGTTPPSLIVVPRSLLHNWKEEAGRFTPRMRVLTYAGADRVPALTARSPSGSTDSLKKGMPISGRELAGRLHPFDVVLTTYGTLRNDIAMLAEVPFDYAILDEAQAIKNAQTESAKAVRKLQASHRLAMSGTPIENHIDELYSLFEFLNPGMLGRHPQRVARPGVPDAPQTSVPGIPPMPGVTAAADNSVHAALARTIRPFILRRTKQDVAKDLPERSEQTIICELGVRQRRLYNELRDYYRDALMVCIAESGIAASRILILKALLRLRQAACHCALVDKAYEETPSAKLDVLLPQLAEVTEEGNKALVFSQFTSLLSIVRKRLDAAGIRYAYLDGRTRDRAACVREFQEDPDCRLFLISLKAGGVGLNLTAAGYVFLLDPWWNPAVEAQAIDRAHRIGQTQRVLACRLIARDTIEERVLELQRSKRELAESIIRADAGLLRTLTAEELSALLS